MNWISFVLGAAALLVAGIIAFAVYVVNDLKNHDTKGD